MERLVWLIGRYGEAIEYDLHATFTLDLLDFFRHKYSWRKLEALLSRLPSGSAFWAAKADDDEAAAAWLAQSGDRPQRPVGPDLQEMSYTNQLLLDICDIQSVLVNRIEALLSAYGGGKPSRVIPALRPETGIARARRKREETAIADLVAEAKAAQARNGVE